MVGGRREGSGHGLVGDLPGAEDHPLDRGRVNPGPVSDLGRGRIVEHGPEVALGQVADGGAGGSRAQERLGREYHQGTAHLATHLGAQEVEVLAGGGEVHDAGVGLGRQRQEPLHPGRRVIRTLPLVAVWQQQHQ